MFSFIRKLFRSSPPKIFIFSPIYERLQLYPKSSEDNYIKAFTHSSYTKKKEEKNERLEFLGDSVIHLFVAEFLFKLTEKKDEGILTKARASIVNRKNLNKIGWDIGMDKYLRHKLSHTQFLLAKDILGNAFEALIGAYYLDYGMEKVSALLEQLLLKDFDMQQFQKSITDPKSYLLEWAQSQKKHVSFLHSMEVIENNEVFSVCLKINGEEKAIGKGKNKKEAEVDACTSAIKALELNQ